MVKAENFTLNKSLTRLKPATALLTIMREWLIIAAAILLCIWKPYLFLLSWFIIGTRMYALYSLLHEGLHYLISPNKSLNDKITRYFLAWPLFINLEGFRKNHYNHHAFLHSEKDPEKEHLKYAEYQFPMTKTTLLFILMKDISGYNFIKYKFKMFVKTMSGGLNAERISLSMRTLLFIGLCIGAVYVKVILLFLVLWILPYISIYQFLNRLRFYSEHLNLSKESRTHTRSLKLNPVIGFFLTPNNLGYHAEHHSFPNVPFYNLPSLHRELESTEWYQNEIELTTDWRLIYKEIIQT